MSSSDCVVVPSKMRPTRAAAGRRGRHRVGTDGPDRLDRPCARGLPLDRRLRHRHGCPGRRRGRGRDKLGQADLEMAAIGGGDDHALPAVRHLDLDRRPAREGGDGERLRVRPAPERRLLVNIGDPRLGMVQEDYAGQVREQEPRFESAVQRRPKRAMVRPAALCAINRHGGVLP